MTDISLSGKKGLIFGIANERSIAYGVASLFNKLGASMCFNYHPIFESKVKALTKDFNPAFVGACDVASDESFDRFFEQLALVWDKFDFVIHSIAYADKESLSNPYLLTKREHFAEAMDISCYSFAKLLSCSAPLISDCGSCLAMSYYGANKYIQNYNVMGVAKAALESSVRYLAMDMGGRGIRVNAISAGPVRTLASAGIAGFRSILEASKQISPLKNNISTVDIAQAAAFLVSDYSRNITAEIMNIDCGFNSVGFVADESHKAV